MKKLLKVSLVLVVIVIVLGSYTRLTDAGLGCPDWPGCYGFMAVPHAPDSVAEAEARFPERPVDHFKAWNEMIHRYAAGLLGLLVLTIAGLAIKRQRQLPAGAAGTRPFKLPLFLAALIIFQALLGMWTVTMMLQPAIVMAHLLGGFSTFSLLALLYLREQQPLAPHPPQGLPRGLFTLAWVTFAVVVLQVALGGWVAANYAALACTELPVCEGNWRERLDFAGAFSIPPAEDYEFGVHSYAERMTMHVSHRFGAVLVILAIMALSVQLLRHRLGQVYDRLAWSLLALLVIQVILGVTNVVATLPLKVAVAHNAVGAFMTVTLVVLLYFLYKSRITTK